MVIPYDPFRQPFVVRSLSFAEELLRRGHEVQFFYTPRSNRGGAGKVRDELPAGLAAHPWTPADVMSIASLGRAIRDADVVHFQKSKPPHSWVALSLAKAYRKPIHQDWDDDEFAFWAQAARDRLGAASLLRPSSVASTIVAAMAAGASGATQRAIPRIVDTVGAATMSLRRKSADWGCEPGAIYPAQVGVDSEMFSPARRDEGLRRELGLDGPTVLHAGSLDIRPDLEFFVLALKALFRKAGNARCLVVGGGFGRDAFVRRLDDEGIASRVRVTEGLIAHAEMPRYVASCDVAALPFRDDAVNRSKSSLTLLEAMSSGLAVVTHDVGDIGWMVGGGGVLAPAGDPEAFATKMAELVADPEARAKLGAAGRARVASAFRWSRTVDHLEAAYRKAIQTRRQVSGSAGAWSKPGRQVSGSAGAWSKPGRQVVA
jgi:glycosyltransferase involved in cell wall biosynthesis